MGNIFLKKKFLNPKEDRSFPLFAHSTYAVLIGYLISSIILIILKWINNKRKSIISSEWILWLKTVGALHSYSWGTHYMSYQHASALHIHELSRQNHRIQSGMW